MHPPEHLAARSRGRHYQTHPTYPTLHKACEEREVRSSQLKLHVARGTWVVVEAAGPVAGVVPSESRWR